MHRAHVEVLVACGKRCWSKMKKGIKKYMTKERTIIKKKKEKPLAMQAMEDADAMVAAAAQANVALNHRPTTRFEPTRAAARA